MRQRSPPRMDQSADGRVPSPRKPADGDEHAFLWLLTNEVLCLPALVESAIHQHAYFQHDTEVVPCAGYS